MVSLAYKGQVLHLARGTHSKFKLTLSPRSLLGYGNAQRQPSQTRRRAPGGEEPSRVHFREALMFDTFWFCVIKTFVGIFALLGGLMAWFSQATG